jgi:hypothetical protein
VGWGWSIRGLQGGRFPQLGNKVRGTGGEGGGAGSWEGAW